MQMRLTGVTVVLAACALAGVIVVPAHAHHSFAMYDGSLYRVFTGVIIRIVPNAAHFEIHFVPLNEERNALGRQRIAHIREDLRNYDRKQQKWDMRTTR